MASRAPTGWVSTTASPLPISGVMDVGGPILDRPLPPLLVGGVGAPDDAVDRLGRGVVELLLRLAGEGVDRRVPALGAVAGGLGLLVGGALRRGHDLILLVRHRCPQGPYPAVGRSRTTGPCHWPDLESGAGTNPGGAPCAVATPR